MKKLIVIAGLVTLIGVGLDIYHNLTSDHEHNATVDNSCVTVYVDYSTGPKTSQCIDVDGTVTGPQIVSEAGYDIEGTQKYPTEIVCRVNNFPGPDLEKCVDMPPADAYWAILVYKNNKWDWATTGIGEITLQAGEGIGLVYADNGEVSFPK